MINLEKIKNNQKIKFFNKKRGFSIGEVMLAVFILGMTLTAIIGMYVSGLRELMDERDSIVASLLAQEGVELVRNIRDNNWATAATGGSFGGLGDTSNCSLSYDDDSCDNDETLYYDGLFYTHSSSGNMLTEFSRKIIVTGTSNDREITSVVTWNNEGFPTSIDECTTANKCVFSESILTEWGE